LRFKDFFFSLKDPCELFKDFLFRLKDLCQLLKDPKPIFNDRFKQKKEG